MDTGSSAMVVSFYMYFTQLFKRLFVCFTWKVNSVQILEMEWGCKSQSVLLFSVEFCKNCLGVTTLLPNQTQFHVENSLSEDNLPKGLRYTVTLRFCI